MFTLNATIQIKQVKNSVAYITFWLTSFETFASKRADSI